MITLSWYHDNMLSYFFFLKTSHTADHHVAGKECCQDARQGAGAAQRT
jgi:hypothetical protein